MQVDHGTGIGTVQNLAYTFHGHTVESQVVNVQSVNADILDKPVQSFHIVIVPAGHSSIYNRSILYIIGKPGSDVILIVMFLKPGISASLTFGENFSVEASQGKDLGTAV